MTSRGAWESPSTDALHQIGLRYPEDSLLKGPPHGDVKAIDASEQREVERHGHQVFSVLGPKDHCFYSLPLVHVQFLHFIHV